MEYFDKDGNLKREVEFGRDMYGEEEIKGEEEAERLVLSGKVSADSDAARIYYARSYYDATEGAVGIVSMYRKVVG